MGNMGWVIVLVLKGKVCKKNRAGESGGNSVAVAEVIPLF